MQDQLNLTGQILIAMPGIGDSRFEHSVILICAHGDDGAMGLMINRHAGQVTLGALCDQLSIDVPRKMAERAVHSGGPVERERGFVLHSSEYKGSVSTLPISDELSMTATLDILEDIAEGRGPARSMMMLGYCGWAPGQLEAELGENGWLIGDPTQELIFDRENAQKWGMSMTAQGINPLLLSPAAGRA
ncbi:YqgE/AlgH family protein [Pseudooceanicola sp. CBS1P-1]|uniref:UPF0301 protein GR170_09920 n=1 Tax=Pseudooceanicola albus TaxID=2692189 RepID=A0A6L7G373_9RHOB|nr:MULTISPECIES: YqgE/AlgH family protein [Pseudooceanicola]MBT9384854.1 YqgE/AlgH family protein [Pseudooceanicola endophyticus]MXN18152.1 YqgE/AlgH family protein [Pseudooceanicola albus]